MKPFRLCLGLLLTSRFLLKLLLTQFSAIFRLLTRKKLLIHLRGLLGQERALLVQLQKKMQPKKRRPEPMPDIANVNLLKVNLLKLENQECCNIQK